MGTPHHNDDAHDDDHRRRRPDYMEPIYTTEEAAVIVGVAPKTLKNWRSREHGPRFLKYGKKRGQGGLVFYPQSALEEYRRLYLHTTPDVHHGGMG